VLKQQLLDASKRARAARKTSTKAKAEGAGGGAAAGLPGPPQQVLPEGVLEKRRAANPRDTPGTASDPDFG
jgi:hypothetical protein